MYERILRVVEERKVHGIVFTIVETAYEFGTHFVVLTNGEPGCHSVDLETCREYVQGIADLTS